LIEITIIKTLKSLKSKICNVDGVKYAKTNRQFKPNEHYAKTKKSNNVVPRPQTKHHRRT